MVIGEGPGWNENRAGVPFVGKAGQELDETYLKLAGLDRSLVYVTNVVQCRQERNGIDVKPGEALAKCCGENHLYREILTVMPKVIVLCGATACSLIGKVDLELEHGFPRKDGVADCPEWEGWVVPMYHPAAGLHETRFMTPMLEDWERLGKWLAGKWQPPQSLGEKPHYRLLQGREVSSVFQRAVVRRPRRSALDTENDEDRPYSAQFSTRPGEGFMVLASDKLGVQCLREGLASEDEIIMHFAGHDLDVADRIGLRPDRWRSIRDTMQELFHLGNLPQGLKAAVYRVFGYRMTSYDEVVTPYSKAILESWLAEALGHASTEVGTVEPHPIGPNCPTCGKKHRTDQTQTKPHACEAVLRRIMGKLGGENDYDPWERPKLVKGVEKPRLIGRPWLEELERVAGRMPRKSIVHAPLEQQIQYACSDADWTGRLAMWLEGERARIVQEEWRVA